MVPCIYPKSFFGLVSYSKCQFKYTVNQLINRCHDSLFISVLLPYAELLWMRREKENNIWEKYHIWTAKIEWQQRFVHHIYVDQI